MRPKRFKITFSEILGKQFSYTVCTYLGERKAIVIAAEFHATKVPDQRIYEVISVEQLSGEDPESDDLTDRMEW